MMIGKSNRTTFSQSLQSFGLVSTKNRQTANNNAQAKREVAGGQVVLLAAARAHATRVRRCADAALARRRAACRVRPPLPPSIQ